MAGSPAYKVYTKQGEYVAACKQPEDAAAVAQMHGVGSTIRYMHGVVLYTWTPEDARNPQPGTTGVVVRHALHEYQAKKYAEVHGPKAVVG